ncbi:hypothetical protein TEQG_06356 [Trichophyton equinum CBS 127.97]|uniref:Uncharacterized protein n=1 Tax=Trichophyton equinum (strain ATCC MYA-4606 / CBS 127.97) TaxID=559882 RepID=F2PZQ3_TRIEC|nr:hypothetical protein TEQG_06356 [Trichophyton equinum CBS 127.97]
MGIREAHKRLVASEVWGGGGVAEWPREGSQVRFRDIGGWRLTGEAEWKTFRGRKREEEEEEVVGNAISRDQHDAGGGTRGDARCEMPASLEPASAGTAQRPGGGRDGEAAGRRAQAAERGRTTLDPGS